MNSKLFKKRAKQVLRAYTKEELEGINFDNPTVDDLISIAEMGNVSTDWLLGIESNCIIDHILESKEIREAIDQCAGKEVKSFVSWSDNWIREPISESAFDELFMQYRKGKRISPSEKRLIELIYKESLLALLVKK